MSALVPVEALLRVRRLHDAIDVSARRLEGLHAARSQCRLGCSDCCVDDLTVSLAEAARITEDHRDLLIASEPAPRGRCAMLDAEGGCRVYASRPYVCRTQGLPLRWIEEDGVERRDICPLNDPPASPATPALEEIPAQHCWTLGAVEQALATIAALDGASSDVRVALRSLFDGARPSSPESPGKVTAPVVRTPSRDAPEKNS